MDKVVHNSSIAKCFGVKVIYSQFPIIDLLDCTHQLNNKLNLKRGDIYCRLMDSLKVVKQNRYLQYTVQPIKKNCRVQQRRQFTVAPLFWYYRTLRDYDKSGSIHI